jgi:hypothetical protein
VLGTDALDLETWTWRAEQDAFAADPPQRYAYTPGAGWSPAPDSRVAGSATPPA